LIEFLTVFLVTFGGVMAAALAAGAFARPRTRRR
jgi:hypothetical protein